MFSPLEVKPLERSRFDAAFAVESLGSVAIARTSSDPATIERSARHVQKTADRRVFLLMPIEGRLQSAHYGHDVVLGEGDFVLTETLAPSLITFHETNRSLGLVLPYDILQGYLPDAEAVFGRRVSGRGGFGELLGTMLRAVWQQVESGVPQELGPALAKSLLGLVATAYAIEHRADVAESSVVIARRAQIKRYIERHLRDADLTAHAVAAGLGLSPRYTRLVFAAEGESISHYILRRRLEECARQLASVLWQGRSITDTAFEWGFSSMPHFTRAFKERFGQTPTEYKRCRVSTRTLTMGMPCEMPGSAAD